MEGASEVIAGRYALCDPIGVGGSGTVWRAFDFERNAYCAAKLLRQRHAGALLRFVREQAVRLTDPHIVGPYAWSADDGMVLIASELIDGGSVQTLLGDFGPLSDATIATVASQVLAALQTVHQASLIHRDVKPGNLLLRATGTGPIHVMLTDFGLTISRQDARLTADGTVIGTPGYLPPEVVAGGAVPDARHDLYAVGRLARTLLTGLEPSISPDPADRSPGQPDVDFTDEALRAAIAAMVQPDPARRPADVPAALQLLGGAVTSARPFTRDGDPVDVLRQLPPLPPGWDPTRGPLSRNTRPAPGGRATLVDSDQAVSGQEVSGQEVSDQEVSDQEVTAGLSGLLLASWPLHAPGDGPPTQAMPLPQPPAATIPAAPPPVLTATSGRTSRRSATARVGRSGRRSVIAAGSAAAVVVAAGATLLLTAPGGSGGARDSVPASTSSSPPGSSTNDDLSTGSQAGVTPTVAAGGSPGTALAGGICSWQQEGDRIAGPAGVVRCARDGGDDYVWVAAAG